MPSGKYIIALLVYAKVFLKQHHFEIIPNLSWHALYTWWAMPEWKQSIHIVRHKRLQWHITQQQRKTVINRAHGFTTSGSNEENENNKQQRDTRILNMGLIKKNGIHVKNAHKTFSKATHFLLNVPRIV